MSENSMAQQDFTTLKAIGDGNCLFRSIIQSLLIQGLIENKKPWVIEFIHGLVKRTEEDLQSNGMEIDHTYITVLKDNPNIINHFNAFIEQYKNLSSTEQEDLFVKTYFDSNELPVLYYLSACLRKDILSHLQENEADENTLENFAALHKYAPLADCAEYFAKHKIRTHLLAGNHDSKLEDYADLSPDVTDWNIHIYLKHNGEEGHKAHYDALKQKQHTPQTISETAAGKEETQSSQGALSDPGLTEEIPAEYSDPFEALALREKRDDPAKEEAQSPASPVAADDGHENTLKDDDKTENTSPHSALETIPEDSNSLLQNDLAIAKNLQIKEIECFARRFKSSDNKDKLSFISDLIKGLGLEKDLSHEQLSHIRALQSSTTIEQIVQSLQSVINELGYSSQFKEQIQRHSFFSTCKQEVRDMTQTLSSTPAIKCN